MFTLFIASLILLIALFTLKLIELRAGRRVLLSGLRRRGDQLVLQMCQKIQNGFYGLLDKTHLYSESWSHRTRRRLSQFFDRLAQKLRK